MVNAPVADAPEITAPGEFTDRPPLRVNVFEFLSQANSALLPMFPYEEPGAIVPCGAVFRSGPGKKLNAFHHFNTVDEIVIVFGAEGVPMRPGQVVVGPKKHHVGPTFANPDDTDQFVMMTITQRQSEPGSHQHEALTFFCSACQAPLAVSAYDSHNAEVVSDPLRVGYAPPLETIIRTYETARSLDDPETRKCKACGHQNEPFPYHNWGWSRYADQVFCSEKALRSFLQLGAR